MKPLLVIRQDDDVIHIPDVVTAAHLFLHPMIKAVQVNIGEKLAREVSYGNTLARRPERSIISFRGEDQADEPEDILVADPL